MTDRDIEGYISALAEAYKREDESVVTEIAFAILGGFLKDVARIADALEVMAAPPR